MVVIMIESLSLTFSPASISSTLSGRGSLWAYLEQEYKTESEKTANLYDIQQMLGLAKLGLSPFSYIADNCQYITTSEDSSKAIIRLDFYVWPSQLDLEYNLSTELGIISNGIIHQEATEFDLIFNGSSYEEMDFIFSGRFTSGMPIIRPDGSKITSMPLVITPISTPYMMVEDSSVTLSEEVYTVFRATGTKKGYKHTITMTLGTETGYKVENLDNSITLKYIDEYGEEQIEVLDLIIPPCVEDLLTTCPNPNNIEDILKYTLVINSDNSNNLYKVYVSSCDGSIVQEGWESK